MNYTLAAAQEEPPSAGNEAPQPLNTAGLDTAPPGVPAPAESGLNAPAPAPMPSGGAALSDTLKRENFSYVPSNMTDPFVSFITPSKSPKAELSGRDGEDGPPVPQKPLTPLQKMSLGQIEGGIKAILWGEMGRRAVIEDSTGKGFLVTVGTPIGGNNGVITEIFEDRLVIQQEMWDQELKRMVPENLIVKLRKEENS